MRLVFIHGMRQEGRAPELLRADWEVTLQNTWMALGIDKPQYDLEMPFYGDELDALTEKVRGPGGRIINRGETSDDRYTDLEAMLLRQFAERAGAKPSDFREELGQHVIDRGPLNWEWVQAAARWLSRNTPWLGHLVLPLVRQVDAYLDRPHIRRAVDAIVGPAFVKGPSVIVAHSLGTIVSYRLLRDYGARADVKLFITLGSPLGIDVVKSRIKPPSLRVPDGVENWVNGSDERDYVALYSKLDAATFTDGIENLTDIKNSPKDPHSVLDYMSDERIGWRIANELKL